MTKPFLSTSEFVVFRNVGEELIVIHLNSGQLYHFTANTKDLLEFFKQPKTLDSYFKAAQVEDQAGEVEHLRNLASFLVEQNILEESSVGEAGESELSFLYSRPNFVRFDDKTLDQIAYLDP